MISHRQERRGNPAPLQLYIGAVAALSTQTVSQEAAKAGPPAQALEAARDAVAQLQCLLDGIDRWQQAPPQQATHSDVIWRTGSAALRQVSPPAKGARSVLVVPSLINGPDILDLDPEVSLIRSLAGAGLAPVLLDWGKPGAAEREFTLSDYVTKRLLPAADWLAAKDGAPPHILGYCLGGTLCLPLAERYASGAAKLCLIGAPWSFAMVDGQGKLLRDALKGAPAGQADAAFCAMGAAFGAIPGEVFQLLFGLLDPLQAARKFRRYVQDDPASPQARRFERVEDWLSTGPPMAAPAAAQLLCDWYIKNTPAIGGWLVGGKYVNPAAISLETLAITGAKDHIAPDPTTRSLPRLIRGATHEEVPFGHVGMIASPRARELVTERVCKFFNGDLL